MDFREYQEKAGRTVNPALTENEQLINAALGLSGEAGEFAEVVKKWRFQEHDFDRDKAIKELGDVLWYLNLGAVSLGINLEEIAERNILKLQQRYPERFSGHHSRNRTPGD